MPIIDDPRYTQNAIAGQVNSGLMLRPQQDEPEPALLDTLAAAARQSTIAGAAYERIANRDPDLPDAPADWDALDHIKGYEEHANALADAATPSDLAGRLSRIDNQRLDRDVLRRSGLGGPGAEITMNLLDPTFLAALAVPELALAKAGRLAKATQAAVEGAVTAGAYEAGMQSLQEDRSATESLFNIGGGALLSGMLGAVLHRAPKVELDAARSALEQESQRSTGGAAATMRESTLEREALAAGGRQLSKGMSKVPLVGTDLDRILSSDSVVANQVLGELADIPGILGKNLQGEASPVSVESLVSRHDARVADFSDQLKTAWLEYRARVPAGTRMSQGDFSTAVASAARRGDKSGIPEVDATAKFLRERVFDPLKKDAMELGLLDDPAKIAREKATTKAVGNYVKAESKQIYADYVAKARAKILSRGDFRKAIKEAYVDPVEIDIPEVQDAIGSILNLSAKNAAKDQLTDAGAVTKYLRRREISEEIGKAYERYTKRLEPLSAKKFAKLAASDAEDIDARRLAKLLREQETGTLSGRVTVPPVEERYLKSVVGADSYFRRMYDREVIRGNLQEWRGILRQWFKTSEGAVDEEIEAAIEDVTRKILGADVGQSNFATKITVSKAGPLQERTLDIPDALIEKFLVNDPMKVASAYVRDLAPQVEMARKFGDIDMKQQIQSISDDYAIRRKQVETSKRTPENKAKELEKLQKQETEALEAMVRIRDRILNRAGRLGPSASEGTRRAVAASRAWRNWVAAARLGGTALTGGTMDMARIASQYGFAATMGNAAKLVASPAFRALSKAQARRAGSAVEVALSRRVNAAYDGAITEGWSQTLANGVYKYTALNHITDFNRTLSATLFEDAVLKAARKTADGGTLPKFDRARLASLGIGDDELRRIAAEVEKHGGEVDGVRVSGSADWEDKALSDIYDAAILRESKIVVQQPGAADRVWWMDSELGKLIGQLKSFSLSAPARLATLPVQAVAQGRYGYAARFVGFMMLGGYLTHSLRQLVAGKKPTTDPKQAAVEAITESGIAGVFPDLLSPVGRRLGFGESVRMSDRNVLSAYGGPALGAAGDVYDFAMNRTQGGMSASDLHMFRRMLPFNNVWYLRRAINALEGETAEALDLQGADNASVFQRIGRTDAVLPTGQRGGTGTGVMQ